MKVVFQVFAALTILLTANPVAAQTGYPNRQVRIIVGFTPGTAQRACSPPSFRTAGACQ